MLASMKQKISYQIKKCLQKASDDPDVLAVILFGSRANKKPSIRPSSDIDLCLVLRPSVYSAIALSKKKISYLELGGDLDIQIFQKLPLPLKHRVIREGKILLCKNEDVLYREAYQVMREFSRFSRIYQNYLDTVLHGR
ncbi:MAG: nucleotidyltransferase domain-containing protein [Candidatus Omnitrophica bacterium]|nr:nucleotidyltransferase domain-containing protein [Candidatus Omnitrophota bacterium]